MDYSLTDPLADEYKEALSEAMAAAARDVLTSARLLSERYAPTLELEGKDTMTSAEWDIPFEDEDGEDAS